MAEIYATVSGKGGVGKSTFVAGVSKGLADLGRRVLAVDCDIGLRSLDLLFGCSDKVVFDWGDLICGRCEKACPQHIKIRDHLLDISKTLV